ncbi:MAG TPA: DUF4232 domain-containing protein [Polyangiaceae bacterium]|nr:DUF4232 domain-containing protein [Polyangiaceae bacterium]
MVAVSGGSASAESAAATPESAAAIPECNVNTLGLSLGDQGAALGTIFRALRFTNISGASCSMTAYPGVSFVAGDDGHQVGPAAQREASSHGTVILAPGAVASAITSQGDPSFYDPSQCQPTDVRGFRVYAPDDRLALFVPLPAGTQACAAIATLGVYAVKAGPGNLGDP